MTVSNLRSSYGVVCPDGFSSKPKSVRVSAGETLALLLHAARTNRAWLNDFAEETIEISPDLYEILLAYKRYAQEENARAA